ncbi:MAG: TRAM domain-containing protein [Gordonia sp. (in: high G+C Gram-positive bacteria)]
MTAVESVRLRVTGFANGGAGVARADGRVVFVSGALPGELVDARIVEERSSFAKAQTIDVVEPSEHRIDIACPAAAAGAGCCDLAYAEPGYARELRAGVLGDVLSRIGGFTADVRTVGPPPVEPLDDAVAGWRVRTRLAVDDAGHEGLRARRSARLVQEHCAAPADGMLDDLSSLGARPGAELAIAVGSDGVRHVAELTVAGKRPAGRGRGAAQRRRSAAAASRAAAHAL